MSHWASLLQINVTIWQKGFVFTNDLDHLDGVAFAKRTFQYDIFYNFGKGNHDYHGDDDD